MICGQAEIHNGKKDTKTASSRTFAIMGVVQLLYVKTEVKSLAVVMKYSLLHFFIGLYFNQKRPLIEDTQKRKTFGQPIQYWGNLDSVKGRKAYPKLREYIFTALVSRTDIDFIALEKGEMTSRKAVDMLMQTMEEYANWGFHFMEDKLTDSPNYFFRETAFLEVFLAFNASIATSIDEEEPESLD